MIQEYKKHPIVEQGVFICFLLIKNILFPQNSGTGRLHVNMFFIANFPAQAAGYAFFCRQYIRISIDHNRIGRA